VSAGDKRMSGSTRTSADLDVRRRRILFRAWHRGTREMDLLMGRFADAAIATLGEAELADFELLIEVPDHDLFAWLSGTAAVPVNYDTVVYRRLQRFHNHGGPIHV
jgi:antitoxin CptB